MSSFISKLQKRVAKEESGFTLIELLIVLVIIGILLAIAVPSYLGFKDRANQTAATANVRATIPSAEAFYSDNGVYTGMDVAALTAIDSGLSPTITMGTVTAATYCIESTVGTKFASFSGPGGAVVQTACP